MKTGRIALTLALVLPVGCGAANARPTTPAAPVVVASTPAPMPAPMEEVAASAREQPKAESAPWQAIENPDARYIAVLDLASVHDGSVTSEHLAHARRVAAQTLQSFDDVQLAPAHFDRAQLLAETQRRKLLGVAFECGVVRHEVDERGTHFGVNVTVVDLRTEDIVATLAGSATAPGPSSPESAELALEGALEGAMRAVPKLLASLEPTLLASQ